jgi:hypothetical protein
MRKENVDRIERVVVAVILALLVCAIVLAFPFHAWSEETTDPDPDPVPSSSPSPSSPASPAVFSPDAPIPASDWIDQWTGRDWEHEA